MFAQSRRMGRRLPCLFAMVVLWLLCGSAHVSLAAEGPVPVNVEIQKMGTLNLVEGKRVLIGYGVRLSYQGATITADEMEYDLDANRIRFQGNVLFQKDKQELRGAAFSYDVNKEEGELIAAQGTLTGENIKGKLYVSGEKVATCKGSITIEGGRLTTCDTSKSHYRLDAQKIEIYPGDRLVIRGVSFWESGIPLFYWPYLVLSLKDRSESQFQLPQIGYNGVDGWFLKTTYNYFTGNQYGFIYADYFQNTGFGGGLRHVYQDNDKAFGAATFYYLGNRRTQHNDLRVEWDQRYTLSNEWSIQSNLSYETRRSLTSGLELRELGGNLRLSQKDEVGNASASISGRRVSGGTDAEGLEEVLGEGQISRQLSPDWNLSLRASTSSKQVGAGAPNRLISYLGEVRKTGPNNALSIAFEERLNPDLKEGVTVPWAALSRTPEVTYEIRGLRLLQWDLPVDTRIGLGQFTELPAGTRATKAGIQMRLRQQTYTLSPQASIYYGGAAEPNFYWVQDLGRYTWYPPESQEREQARLRLESQVGWRYTPIRPLSLDVQYGYEEAYGTTPFAFDQVPLNERITGQVQWTDAKWSLSLSSGYDLVSQLPQDVVARLRLYPSSKLKLDLQTNYSLVSQSVGGLVGIVELQPTQNWTLKLGAKMNLTPGAERLDRVDSQVDVALPGNWKIGYIGIWNGVDARFLRGNLAITKVIEECREVGLKFDQVRKEVWLEYRILAFPQAGLKVGADQEGLMFDTDVFRKLLESLSGGQTGR